MSRPRVRQILLAGLSLLLSGCAGEGASSASTGTGILIEGALVLDGTGAEGVVTDVRVRGSRIEAIGELSATEGELVIDAAGLALAPGFIDTHSHHDGGLLDDLEALASSHLLRTRPGITAPTEELLEAIQSLRG